MEMHLPGTVEWLYSTHCAILPFRWENVNCCPKSCPNADRNDLSCNVCLRGRDPQNDHGRSTILPYLSYMNSDATCATLRETLQDPDEEDDAKLSSESKEEDPADCKNGECPQEQSRCIPSQEVASDGRDESLDWKEEKKLWIRAAGVSTPSDLERKLEDMRTAATQNEADLKELSCHVAEVKTFLLQLHDVEKYFGKRKRKGERLGRRRKRSRRKCDALDCCCDAMSDCEESSTERPPKQGGRPLLDPQIMKSFGNLIKSSA
ncbi:unnamed protein product [Calypogeia fissa]